MSGEVQVGGETRHVDEFSGFKAIKIGSAVRELIAQAPQVLSAGAAFKRAYEAEHYIEMDRAEARIELRPRPLYRDAPELDKDGDVVALKAEPILNEHGEPVLGPDPLAHLTERDWEESGHRYRQRQSPAEELEWAAMFPVAFDVGRTAILRLFALFLASNADLERWDLDPETDVDSKLEEEGGLLLHKMRGGEPFRLAGAVIAAIRDQFADDLADLRGQMGNLKAAVRPAAPETRAPAMTVEADTDGSSTKSPISSISSPAGTGEESTTSGPSTERVGDSSSPSGDG